ncbi:ArnT family glycosyltransferase [Alcaligenes endophyticus]|uniref:Glycosyltransferase n=1 Tax=Alcaligenes endophyticus TaxID=1929088 RepID=A0ABT8EHV9_9BURK|nr:glycosyltransferase [Alcaligenes endophyticus]MCX5592688.1 glycosyltransferase [Alcaligenes endophyticus]MDN4120876.1 glycosyltransferase [Alcaligenes endophyticus]
MPPNTLFSTPARLTAPAAVKLPRQILVLTGLIYILAGLFFRDPWKTDDVVSLATMLTAINDGSLKAWLLPQVGHLAYAEAGPFTTWIGALSISLLAPVFTLFTSELNAAIIASRMPNLLWFGLLCVGLWRASYWLGRRPEAQPVRLPFGGEPSITDYGRMIADATLLLTLATVGIIWRMHETSEVPALIGFQAIVIYSLVRMFQRPGSGAALLGLTLGVCFLTRGIVGASPILLASVLSIAFVQPLQKHAKWLALSLAIATAIVMAWWIPAQRIGPYWTQQWLLWNLQSVAWVGFAALLNSLRDLAWFLWPTWPLTLLAIWQWRAWVRAPHLLLPLIFLGSSFSSLLFIQGSFEPEYSLLVLPCALLGAFALPTLRRGIVNALDWFAIMCFSLTAATVWLGWIAQQTGWPSKIAHNIARQTQGYDTFISIPAILIALVGTAAWILLVRWRLSVRPAGLLRGTVLSAGGLITTWLLLVTLWMPSLDYVRSYRSVSADLAQALRTHQQAGECLRAEGVGSGQRASFLVFEQINLSFDRRCSLVLQQVSLRDLQRQQVAPLAANADILWQGKREADRHEAFLLIRLPKPH